MTVLVGTVAFRLRVTVRSGRVPLVVSTAVTAVVIGVILSIALGAQRTSSAPERYTAKYVGGFDVSVMQNAERPMTASVARLSAVKAVSSDTFVFGGLTRGGSPGGEDSVDATVVAGDLGGASSHIVSGHAPDPHRPGDFVATRLFLSSGGAKVGDDFTLMTLSAEQAATSGFGTEHPDGPVVRATLVGVIESPGELDEASSIAIFSPALIDDRAIGIASTSMAVELSAGADVSQLGAQLATLAPSSNWTVEKAQFISPTIRAAVRGQAEGLWAVAGVAALAGLVVLGQLITRQVRLASEEEAKLSALGMTRGQIIAETMGRAVVPTVLGVVLGAALAVIPSARFPTGFVRQLEPAVGARIEWTVLVPAVAGLVAALLGWSLVSLLRARRLPAARPSVIVDAVASRVPSASMSTGVRFAFRRGGRDSAGARSATAGLAFACVGLVGALTFGASLNRLIDNPRRYGTNFDLGFGLGEDQLDPALTARLQADPEITGLTYYGLSAAKVQHTTLWVVGYQPARGNLAPTLIAGRIPRTGDEIALGRLMAATLHTKVGGRVDVDLAGARHRFLVTGLVMVPDLAGNGGLGQDGLVTLPTLQGMDRSVKVTNALAAVRPGAPPGTLERVWRRALQWESSDPLPSWLRSRPTAIVNIIRIRSTPALLAGVLGALGALTIASAVWSSVGRRRRDLAILRSMGAGRGFILRATSWQAVALVVIPVILGLPVGAAIGGRVFRLFADAMGVINGAAIPTTELGGAVVAALLVAKLTASIAARRVEHRTPADLLRPE